MVAPGNLEKGYQLRRSWPPPNSWGDAYLPFVRTKGCQESPGRLRSHPSCSRSTPDDVRGVLFVLYCATRTVDWRFVAGGQRQKSASQDVLPERLPGIKHPRPVHGGTY